ncbi:MAG: hypothetical protein V1731_00115 [Candidatus Aenigmatarchaeota archaeon]
MQINNFQRFVDNMSVEEALLEKTRAELGEATEANIADKVIALARLASANGIELEQALLKRIDESRKGL